MKTCTKCCEEKSMASFSVDRRKPDGRHPQCKGCLREYRRINADVIRERKREYNARPESRYRMYELSAGYRGIDFNLTMEDFMKYWQMPCVHCGSAIETIGLDRVDSMKPYEVSNVEPCCSFCNRMKSDLSTDDWYNQLFKIVNHRKTKDDSKQHGGSS